MVRIRLLTGWSCLALCCSLPLYAQTLKLEHVGTISERADTVRANGTYAYLGAGQTLSVVDVTDLSAPKLRGTLTLPGPVYAIALAGSLAYVANGLPGLAVVDVSKPDAIAVVGSLRTPGEALRVAVTGTKAVVVNRASGLEVIDVSNAAKPASLGSFYTEGYARDVAVSGPLAYVVDSTTDFSIVDLSKPGPPTDVSTQELGVRSDNVAVTPSEGSTRGANAAYLLGGGVLQVLDVSNPSAPAKVTTYKLPGRAPTCGAPPCAALATRGSLAYVAAGAEGVQIVDVSDPSKPVLAGSYRTAGPARDVAVAGSLIFVVVGEARPPAGSNAAGAPAGVLILRQSS
jgi:hypothetical protein